MSIASISSLSIAASIAGTDRAAGAEVASSHRKGGGGAAATGAADSAVEQGEKITKSDLSGDSDADGRQMLDTFERRHQDESEEQHDGDGAQNELNNGPPHNPNVIVNRPILGGHIDLCG